MVQVARRCCRRTNPRFWIFPILKKPKKFSQWNNVHRKENKRFNFLLWLAHSTKCKSWVYPLVPTTLLVNKCSYGTSSPAGFVLSQTLALLHPTLIGFLFFSQIGPVCWLRDASYVRRGGKSPTSCPRSRPDHDKAAGLCYESCPPGYSGVRNIFSREECARNLPSSLHALLIPWALHGTYDVPVTQCIFLG